jgi:hypothetical protein
MRFACLLAACLTLAAQPISQHPGNPRYYLYQGRPTVLITSAEHYGAVINGKFDYLKYLDALKKDGMNLTRIFVGPYRELPGDFGITNNTLAPAADDYLAPYPRTVAGAAKDGRAKYDLSRWNPVYWDRLKKFIAAAGERGIIVEVTLFCVYYEDRQWDISALHAANNNAGLPETPRLEVYTLKHPALFTQQEKFVRKVVAELRDADNVIYELINEPYTRQAGDDWQRRISQIIRDAEAGQPKKHLIAQNIANFAARVEDPDPNVNIFNFHYARPPVTVAMNAAHNRILGLDETGFDGTLDAIYRIQAWDFLLAGGAHYNNLDYSFTVGHEDGSFAVPGTAPGGGSADLRRQLKILSEFLGGFDLIRSAPANDMVLSSSGGVSISVLEQRAEAWAVYIHTGIVRQGYRPRYQYRTGSSPATLTLNLPAGSFTGEWIDTRSGTTVRTDQISHAGGSLPLVSPSFSEDIALRLVRVSRQTN